MSSNAPKLKVNIGADTSDFEKGAKTAKQGLRDLEKVGGDALGKLGDAFGVNTGKLGQMTSALQGLGAKLTACGDAGSKAFGSILTSIAPVAGAIAGLGIGAATAAFKALNAEAQNFKTTVAGANLEMATAAYVDTYKQVLHDFNSGTGEAVANAQSKWSKFWGTLGASFKTYFSTGAFAESLIQGEGGITTGEGTREYFNRLDEANKAATRAEEISNEIYKLERERSDNLVRVAQLDAEIAANRVIMSDATATLAQRQAAAAAAEELINEKYRIRIPLETQIADLMEEANDLASSPLAQIDAANQQRILANQLAAQQNQELRTINRTSASIANAAAREAAERRAAAAATAATRATAISRRVDNAVTQAIFTRLIEPDEAQEAELRAHLTNALETAIPVNFTPDEAGLRQLAEAVQAAVQSYADTKGVDLNNLPKMPQIQAPKLEAPVEIIPPKQEEVADFKRVLEASLGTATLTVDLAVNTDQLIDITQQIESTVQSLAESTGEVLGELAGNLINGSGAWDTFKNSALSAFGDMAVSVGKMAVSTGVATLGIKAALESLNGYAAIAAGVALIALGAAVKTGLSNVAAGNYNANTNVASTTASNANTSDWAESEITVNVTGTLEADGDTLITVIQNTENKNKHTT